MALNIKNPRTEQLATEVARLSGESKTRAITRSLEMRLRRLRMERAGIDRAIYLKRFLEEEIWPEVPRARLGKPMTKSEREEILGIGELGV